jgi:quercetin dioxygenase-like cupin family protein
MAIYPNTKAEPVAMLPGITRRTLADGATMMLCEITLEAGVEVPVHSHPHEQVGYVVRGRLEMIIDGQRREVGPGDSYYAPGDVPHGAHALETSVVVDVFNPPRDDYR